MKLITLINSVESLNKLSEQKLPAQLGFELLKFLKDITTDIDTYHKVRNEKVKEYGRPILDEQGNPTDQVAFSDEGSKELNENGKKFIAEMQEMEEKEVDVRVPEISVKDLKDAVMAPVDLAKLSWLIK